MAAPAPRDRPLPRGRPLRDLRRLRVVGHDPGRRRPQRDVPGRRRRAPPLVARRGRRHVGRGDRLLPGDRAVRASFAGGTTSCSSRTSAAATRTSSASTTPRSSTWSRSTRTGAASSGCSRTRSGRATRVGVVANSDGHKGRPGASHPGASTFGAYGGLTCVLADSLTREAVFDAIRRRRCYAVTAAQRIHVELTVNGLPMGAEGRVDGPGEDRRPRRRAPARSSGSTSSAGSSVSDGVAVLRGLVRGLAPLPHRVGGLARARARPPDDLGRRTSSSRPAASSTRCRSRWRTRRRASRRSATPASRWISNTTGDDDGVDLTLDAPADAVAAPSARRCIEPRRARWPTSPTATRAPSPRAAWTCACSCAACPRATRRREIRFDVHRPHAAPRRPRTRTGSA